MGTIEDLYKLIEQENIVLDITDSLPGCVNGVYIKSPSSHPIIGINKNIENNLILLKMTLAEELGHHFTSVGNCSALFNSYNQRTIITKSEIKALKWATEFLLPLHLLKKTLIGVHNRTIDCPAEHLGVTKEFFLCRLNYLSKKYDSIDLDENISLALTALPTIYTKSNIK